MGLKLNHVDLGMLREGLRSLAYYVSDDHKLSPFTPVVMRTKIGKKDEIDASFYIDYEELKTADGKTQGRIILTPASYYTIGVKKCKTPKKKPANSSSKRKKR